MNESVGVGMVKHNRQVKFCVKTRRMAVLVCWFQVVFEGMWGPNRASGTISIDDISFYEGDCTSKFS